MSQSRNSENEQNGELGRNHRELSRMMRQGRSFSGLERNCMFLNPGTSPTGDGRFATISAASGVDFPDDGRAVVVTDWDRDGDLDLWISNRNAPRLRFFRNDTDSGHHFLALRVRGNGKSTNRDAVGARVEVVAEGDAYPRVATVRAGEGFLGQSSKWVHFGLGNGAKIEKVVVRWPGGQAQEYRGIETDRRYELVQDRMEPVALADDETPSALKDSLIEVPVSPQKARIPLLTRVPKPTVSFEQLDGKASTLVTGRGRPVLVTLWASWCGPCLEEFSAFKEREADIRAAGVGVLALSVDGLGDDRSDPGRAQELLERIQYPFPAGRATAALIKDLQDIHNLLIPIERPLPVPTSFLFDENGRLAVLYKGRVSVDEFLNDAAQPEGTWADRLARAAPFGGRTIREQALVHAAEEDQATALFYLGTRMDDEGRLEDAAALYSDVLRIRPESFKAHYNLGRTYDRAGQYLLAMNQYQAATENNPGFAAAYVGLAELMLRKRDLGRATEFYAKALDGSPGDVVILTNLGTSLAGLGHLEKAAERLEEAVRMSPDYPEARYNLGVVYLRQGKSARALREFTSLTQIAPAYPGVQYNLGVLFELEEAWDQAAYHYEQELRNYPESARAHNSLGAILERIGNLDGAVTHYAEAARLAPQQTVFSNNLERLRRAKSSP